MLRKFRIIAALFCFLFITLLFLDFTGSIHVWFGWLAKIQFLPAVLALNVAVVLALIILTLIFGRIYCSVICPMGVFQDIVSRISSRQKKKKYRMLLVQLSCAVLLFTGHIMAEVRCIGRFHHRPRCRYQLFRFITRSLQLIRADRAKPFCSGLRVGQ